MAYNPRTTAFSSQHVRASSGLGGGHPSALLSSQGSNLQARINEKKLELESLKQLRDLSAGLAGQMQQLEEKLATLSNGTEAVAAVMGNWATVLRAIHMASAKLPQAPDAADAQGQQEEDNDAKQALPQTLVRIPIQQAEAAAQTDEQKRGLTG
jgi:DASH complex subunit DAD2